jgi:hypothetical protein
VIGWRSKDRHCGTNAPSLRSEPRDPRKIIQKLKFYSNNIKDFQGRGRGSPLASFWDESTKNKEEKHGAEPCRTLLQYPPPHPCVLPVVVGRYAPSSRAPCRRCVIHVVVGPYASLLGLTCGCWALCVVVGSPYRGWGLHVVLSGNFKPGQWAASPSSPTCRG